MKICVHVRTCCVRHCPAGISAGVIAGLLGLGGGLVLGPLMLELGVDPAVSAATTQVWLGGWPIIATTTGGTGSAGYICVAHS